MSTLCANSSVASASVWEIERVKKAWTAFQARALTESREKLERGRAVINDGKKKKKKGTPSDPD